MIFVFKTDEAMRAFCEGVKTIHKKDFPQEALKELEAYNEALKKKGLKGFEFVD